MIVIGCDDCHGKDEKPETSGEEAEKKQEEDEDGHLDVHEQKKVDRVSGI
jgi:hypothetical protein